MFTLHEFHRIESMVCFVILWKHNSNIKIDKIYNDSVLENMHRIGRSKSNNNLFFMNTEQSSDFPTTGFACDCPQNYEGDHCEDLITITSLPTTTSM